MSSDSDSDEFYDAEDQTPARHKRLPSAGGAGDGLDQDLRAIEEEEKRLLELRKLADEKRRQEDEELQRQLQELEEKKKQEAERRAAELEQRRKKLEEMRRIVAEENTPQRQQETVVSEEKEDSQDVGHDVINENVTSGGHDGDDALRVRLDFDAEAEPSEELPDTNRNHGNEDVQSCDRENIENEQRQNNEILEGASAPPVETLDTNVPSLISSVCEPEPDLIQSTKRPNDLPVAVPDVSTEGSAEAPPPPKAPPRRKKKAKPVVRDAEGAEAEPSENIHSPTSATILNLTKDFENSLDLSSATCGAMMVETKDDVAAKAEKAEDEDSERGSMQSEDIANTRPRSNSGRFLTDTEILEQVSVLNLDTGEKIPLSLAEDKIPRCMNPLSLHIMRRTKEYCSDSSLHKEEQSDDEPDHKTGTLSTQATAIKKKGIRLKKFIGKKMEQTVTKIKNVAEEVLQKEESESDDEEIDGKKQIKIKASRSNGGPHDFLNLKPIQDLGGEHTGAVWSMKFSHCGRLLASGGQDNVLRVWVLKESSAYFDEMRQKYSETKMSPAPSENSLNSDDHLSETVVDTMSRTSVQTDEGAVGGSEEEEYRNAPFARKPFCSYRGHTADLLDLSWSKNYFILSSSMDKTVRLWHISRRECLCCFQHIDFVTAIAFHPRDDRYFLSGSLDGKIRLWNIPDKKVALWNEVTGSSKLITAANFCQNGKFAVVGTYDGRVIFYTTEQMKYYTQIHARSTRGKNARGRKVTGIEPLPGQDKVLVTSNDSRLRLYDLRDLTLHCKYKGCANNSSQIKASFSSNGKYIICGSEDKFVYIWKTHHEFNKFSSVRRDRNGYWEGVRAHLAVVTVAIFSPNPSLIIKRRSVPEESTAEGDKSEKKDHPGEVFVSADFSGAIRVFKNKFKPPPVHS